MKVYRSLVFWGGIVVMGFIVWAWRDSTRFESAVGHGFLFLGNDESAVTFCHQHGPGVVNEWGASREYLNDGTMRIEGVGFETRLMPGSGIRVHTLKISHAWLLLGTAGVWGVCLWWRECRGAACGR